MLGNHEDAKDCLQIAFLHCWRARAGMHQVRDLRAWIWQIGLNAGRDYRDLVWRRRAKPLGTILARACNSETAPAERLVSREEQDRLRAALEQLRPNERGVFVLRQQGDLTYEEIARRQRVPVGTAKTLMHKAVRKLRGILCDKAVQRAS